MADGLLIAQVMLISVLITSTRHNDKMANRIRELETANGDHQLKISEMLGTIGKEKHIQKKIAEIIHNYNHEFRQVILSILEDTPATGTPVDHNRTRKEFFEYTLSQIKEIFDILTGDSCSACVKYLDNDYVSTIARDHVSSRSRGEADANPRLKKYKYSENTAFGRIMKEGYRYFLSNNLHAMGDDYVNVNQKWQKLYNATLVQPIRYLRDGGVGGVDGEAEVIGFICVDNMKGNFEEPIAIDILAAFSDPMYHMMYTITKAPATVRGKSDPSGASVAHT